MNFFGATAFHVRTHRNDTNKIPYRPYIDGLRGIAIIAVVLYHAKLLAVTGGFIGVDVFFVISGFLITSVIVRDLKAGTFTLLGFWERRVRRILPALFAVMFCSIVAASALMLYPPDYHLFGTTVVAQSVFTSNMLFMVTDNYFGQSSSFSPLLHTWSLSVEEQFYILFPFIVLFCVWLTRWFCGRAKEWRGHAVLFAAVVVLGVASFFLNVWFVDIAPASVLKMPFFPDTIYWRTTYATAGFYLLATRVWELTLGIGIALYAVKIRSAILAEVTGCMGIAAIVVSAFLFNDGTAFPGIAALLPTLGAAAIIVANENHPTRTGVLLSYSALVWIGLISYSLYLWHWPLFVFTNLASPVPLSKFGMAALSLVAVVIAWFSYRFIETPFRKKTLIQKRSMVFLFGFAALTLVAFSGFLIERSVFVNDRIPPAAKNILLASQENVPWGAECFQEPGDGLQYGGLCRIGDPKTAVMPTFVVWGDSHADALVPLFELLGLTYHAQGVVFDGADCVPINGVHQTPPAAGCEEENAFALQYIKDKNIRNIFLVARWSYYVTGGQRGLLTARITDSNSPSMSSAEAALVFERNLIPMVQELSREGRKVTIVEQVPEQFNFNTRDAFYRAVHSGQDVRSLAISTKDNEAYQALPNSVIDGLTTLPGVHVIDPATMLCKSGDLCELENGGRLIYRDEDHLSTAGAMILGPLFTPTFESMRSGK